MCNTATHGQMTYLFLGGMYITNIEIGSFTAILCTLSGTVFPDVIGMISYKALATIRNCQKSKKVFEVSDMKTWEARWFKKVDTHSWWSLPYKCSHSIPFLLSLVSLLWILSLIFYTSEETFVFFTKTVVLAPAVCYVIHIVADCFYHDEVYIFYPFITIENKGSNYWKHASEEQVHADNDLAITLTGGMLCLIDVNATLLVVSMCVILYLGYKAIEYLLLLLCKNKNPT